MTHIKGTSNLGRVAREVFGARRAKKADRISNDCRLGSHARCTGNWKPGKAADRYCECECHKTKAAKP